MRKENSQNSTYTRKASTEEKTSVCSASTKSTAISGVENLGMKPLRKCKVCGKEANNALELGLFKRSLECKHKRMNLCNECYEDKYGRNNRERRMSFQGKQIYMPVNMRTNICQICGRTKQENLGFQMAMHHDLYIKGNPLDFTVEECLYCHPKEKVKTNAL